MHERIRPETRTLDALIQTALHQEAAATSGHDADRLLFLGNPHQAFPIAVIKDPILAPVDKLVWMTIRLAVRETAGHSTFPGYDTIAEIVNVASRSTIARAIAILRATRWLTLCGRWRTTHGRFGGNLYALHDEPLPLTDAIHLDRDYMAFLHQAISHGHARVRSVVQGVLDSLEEEVQAGRNVCAMEHPLERRLTATEATEQGVPRRFFAFTAQVILRLRQDRMTADSDLDHHDQKSNTARLYRVRNSTGQKSNSVDSSSNNKYITTTGAMSKIDICAEEGRPLIYPKRLGDNQRDLANRYLRPLTPILRQQLLDELEGRFQAEQKGMPAVYDEISFLIRLCQRAQAGQFQPNLGLKVAEARRARDTERQRLSQQAAAPAPKHTEAQRQRRLAVAQDRIMTMRQALGTLPAAKSSQLLKRPD